jgi:hypothetical protein
MERHDWQGLRKSSSQHGNGRNQMAPFRTSSGGDPQSRRCRRRMRWNEVICGRQFDVTIRYRKGLYDHLTVVECKDLSQGRIFDVFVLPLTPSYMADLLCHLVAPLREVLAARPLISEARYGHAARRGIPSWEELLDLWRGFGPTPIWNHANRALSNANRFKVNASGQLARRSLLWHDACTVGHHG